MTLSSSRKSTNKIKAPYHEISPKQIIKDINKNSEQTRVVKIKNIDVVCCSNVYPSDKFRTTNFLLDAISPFLKNARICDMGCGPGIVGLYAYMQGAKKVVQADINPSAVENAEKNRTYHKINEKKMRIYLSDCFDQVPAQKFDVIVFNLPFHSDAINITTPLDYAFFDPSFKTLKKFLNQAAKYSLNGDTCVFLAFSNKGDVKALENILEDSIFNWKLWKVTNQDQKYDNRIYMLRKL